MIRTNKQGWLRRLWRCVAALTAWLQREVGKDPDAPLLPLGAHALFVDHSDRFLVYEDDNSITVWEAGTDISSVPRPPYWFRARKYDGSEYIVEGVRIPDELQRKGIARSLYMSVAMRLARRNVYLLPASTLTPYGCALWNSLGRDCPGLFGRGYNAAAEQIHCKLPRLSM